MATVTTAPWVGGMKGRLRNVYFAQTPQGTQMRALPERRKAATPGEMAQRERMATIGAAWSALDREATLVWSEYAKNSIPDRDGAKRLGVSGYNAFSALASTLLRLAPEVPLPVLPPSGPFFGDAAGVQAFGTPSREEPSPLGEGRVGVPDVSETGAGVAGNRKDPTPAPPQGEGTGKRVVFRGSQANAAGVVTELLIQPLASAGRTPRPRGYVSAGFASFVEGALEAEV